MPFSNVLSKKRRKKIIKTLKLKPSRCKTSTIRKTANAVNSREGGRNILREGVRKGEVGRR